MIRSRVLDHRKNLEEQPNQRENGSINTYVSRDRQSLKETWCFSCIAAPSRLILRPSWASSGRNCCPESVQTSQKPKAGSDDVSSPVSLQIASKAVGSGGFDLIRLIAIKKLIDGQLYYISPSAENLFKDLLFEFHINFPAARHFISRTVRCWSGGRRPRML